MTDKIKCATFDHSQMSEADWDKVRRLMQDAQADQSREELRRRYECQWSPEQLEKGPDQGVVGRTRETSCSGQPGRERPGNGEHGPDTKGSGE